MSDSANENGRADRRPTDHEPDAHGQAALMLAESILHALIDTSTLSVEGALAVVRVAQEVNAEGTKAADGPPARKASLALLDQIAISLETENR